MPDARAQIVDVISSFNLGVNLESRLSSMLSMIYARRSNSVAKMGTFEAAPKLRKISSLFGRLVTKSHVNKFGRDCRIGSNSLLS